MEGQEDGIPERLHRAPQSNKTIKTPCRGQLKKNVFLVYGKTEIKLVHTRRGKLLTCKHCAVIYRLWTGRSFTLFFFSRPTRINARRGPNRTNEKNV